MNRVRLSVLAIAAAAFALASPVAAASCNGNGHELALSSGAATPGAGTTSTVITFSVRYADTAGCVPSRIGVAIAGVGTFALTGSGSNYSGGVIFTRTMTLPPGSHAYSFTATSGSGQGGVKSVTLQAVAPSRVLISAPATPAPPAPPAPAPAPPAQPPAPSAPAPAPAAPPPTPTTVPEPKPAAASRTPQPSAGAPGAGPAEPTPPTHGRPALDGWWLALQAHPDLRPGPATTLLPESPGSVEAPAFDIGLALDGSLEPLVAYGVTTAGGLAMFFFLLRRRALDEPVPVALVQATLPEFPVNGGSAVSSPAMSAPAPGASDPAHAGGPPRPSLSAIRDLIPPLDYDLLLDPEPRPGPAPNEAGTPRWLRPSVRHGRFGTEQRRRDWGD